MLSLSKFQTKVVNAPKGINLVAVGAGSGSTYAAMVRSMMICKEEDKHVVILLPTKHQSRNYFKSLILLMETVGYRASRVSQIFTNIHTGSKIKVFSPSKEDLIITNLKGEYIVEQPYHFKVSDMHTIIQSAIAGEVTLTLLSNPIHCGNKDGWDYGLLKTDVMDVLWDEMSEFKAQPEHYKDGVNVITGYSYQDNPYIDSSLEGVDLSVLADKGLAQTFFGVWKKNELKGM